MWLAVADHVSDVRYILQSCLPRNPSMLPSFVIADKQRYTEKKVEGNRKWMAAMSDEGTKAVWLAVVDRFSDAKYILQSCLPRIPFTYACERRQAELQSTRCRAQMDRAQKEA